MSTSPPARLREVIPRRSSGGREQGLYVSDYAELSRRVKAAGLLGRRRGAYWTRSALLVAALAVGVAVLVLLGRSWWQLGVAAWFGVTFAQAGFLAHDGAHRQIFESGRRNEWFSLIVTNLVVGLGYGWWMHKHTRHHGNPNTLGKDPDIDANLIVFTPADSSARGGLGGWIARRQGWIFIPALTLTGLDLHVKTVRTLLRRDGAKHVQLERVLIAVRLLGLPLAIVLVAGPLVGGIAVVVQLAVFGFFLGGAFAPNHIGMPLIERSHKVDYLRRQVLTSRNIHGGRLLDVVMGGLNHQIEHHLFPSMPSANLRAARALIREYCHSLDIPYLERTLVEAARDVVQSVHRVGIRHADPFDCPAAAALRMA